MRLALLLLVPRRLRGRCTIAQAVAPDEFALDGECAPPARPSKGTEGRVAIKFYPGGVMGNDTVVLRKIRLGQLQGGAFCRERVDAGLQEQIYSLPFLFRDYSWMPCAPGRPLLIDGFAQNGFQIVGISGVGFALT